MTTISPKGMDPEGLLRLRQTLESTYGLLMDNAQLRKALGYRTQSAFDRAMKHRQIGVRIFRVPGRTGWFALAADVAAWLWSVREQHAWDHEGAKELSSG